MITINGKKFAESESEFMASLFVPGGTCDGYAKKVKKDTALHLSTPQGKLFAAFVTNPDGCYIVSASRLDNGQAWYMRGGITRQTEQALNMVGMKYSEVMKFAEDVCGQYLNKVERFIYI